MQIVFSDGKGVQFRYKDSNSHHHNELLAYFSTQAKRRGTAMTSEIQLPLFDKIRDISTKVRIESAICDVLAEDMILTAHSGPVGAIYEYQIYCWHCLPESVSSSDSPLDPFFFYTDWGFIPKCYVCQAEIRVLIASLLPNFILKRGLIVGNIKSNEVGEIIRWAFGEHASAYSYQVRCAEDGAIEIWHRSDICLEPVHGMKWK